MHAHTHVHAHLHTSTPHHLHNPPPHPPHIHTRQAIDNVLKQRPGVVGHPQLVVMPAHERVASVACGDGHTALVTLSGRLYTCGDNREGQLGLGHFEDVSIPTLVTALDPWGGDEDRVRDVMGGRGAVGVACGQQHTLVLMHDGSVWTFGRNRCGQLGGGKAGSAVRGVCAPVCVMQLAMQGLVGDRVVCGGECSAVLLQRAGASGSVRPRVVVGGMVDLAGIREWWEAEGTHDGQRVREGRWRQGQAEWRDSRRGYGWEDRFAEVRVLVPVGAGVCGKDVMVNISEAHLRVALAGDGIVVDVDLFAHVQTTARCVIVCSGARTDARTRTHRYARTRAYAYACTHSWWQLEDKCWYGGEQQRCLVVTLAKLMRLAWVALEPVDNDMTDGWWDLTDPHAHESNGAAGATPPDVPPAAASDLWPRESAPSNASADCNDHDDRLDHAGGACSTAMARGGAEGGEARANENVTRYPANRRADESKRVVPGQREVPDEGLVDEEQALDADDAVIGHVEQGDLQVCRARACNTLTRTRTRARTHTHTHKHTHTHTHARTHTHTGTRITGR